MDKSYRIRLGVSFLLIAAFCGAVVVRSAYIMLVPSKQLSDALAKQFRQTPKPQPRRGMILDRNREPLAVSLDVKSLYADPDKVKSKRVLAKKLARILAIPAEKINAKLDQERDFVWIKRYLTKTEEARVRDLLDDDRQLNLALGFANESKRFYPNMELAAHVIGFTGVDSHGLEGLEYNYESELSGKTLGPDAVEGKNLILTIDKGLQHTLEFELQKGANQVGAKGAVGIVMDADTGDIWAMASYPTYNPNDFKNAKPESRRNRVVTDAFEPGSTIKTILISGAIETGTVKPNSKFFCENGKIQIGDRWVKEFSEDHGHGWLTVEDIIKFSSNVGATKIGFKFGKENLYKWYLKQGIAAKTEIDLPGEAVGSLAKPSSWSEIQFSNISFGQGMASTPLQIIRAFAAIVNNGFLVRPRVVAAMEYADSQKIEKMPIKLTRALKPQTSRVMSRMLTRVTDEDGTGLKAKIAGFEIAGKTGTAQVAEHGLGYATKKYIASFVGFPQDVKPNLIGLVVVMEPTFPQISGGDVAAPIFQRVMSVALARAGVSPKIETNDEDIQLGQNSQPRGAEPKANVISKPAPDVVVEKALNRLTDLQAKELGQFVMPDLIGTSARQVLDSFNEKMVRLQIQGSGIVVEQSPKPGELYKKGQTVSIRLYPSETINR